MGQACTVLCSKDVAPPTSTTTAVVADSPKSSQTNNAASTGSKTGPDEIQAPADSRRKRLSVTHCDPVAVDQLKVESVTDKNGAAKNGDYAVIDLLRKNHILEHFRQDEKSLARRSIAISAALDPKNKKTFDEKELAAEGGKSPAEVQKTLLGMGIGFVCKKGKKPDAPNQDAFTVVVLEGKLQLFGVFDGHGPNGHDVSNFCRENIPKLFLRSEHREMDPKKAFEESFIECQRMLAHLARKQELECDMSGSTCTVAYHDIPKNLLTIAHVGDSRAVLCSTKGNRGTVCNETEDHKPDLPAERRTIETAGGRVVFDGFYNHRVFTTDGRGGLNMSRALGDCIAHLAGVSAWPEVMTIQLDVLRSPDEKLVLLVCSDGVWEFISSKEAAEFAAKHDLQAACENLAVKSKDLWLKDSGGEVTDDITAIIACL